MTTNHFNLPPTSRKTALITGGAVRIGAAISHYLYKRGWNVIVHSQDLNKAITFVNSLKQTGDEDQQAFPISFNLSSLPSIENALATLDLEQLKIDALIHNASTFYATPAGTIKPVNWQELMSSNASGPLFLSQYLIDSLKKNKGGCIVSVLDIHALGQPYQQHVVYNMAKAAQTAMVLSLAKDLAPLIRVNAVAPGTIIWPDKHQLGAIQADEQSRILHSIPLGRLGSPRDIAHAVNFLLEANYITGQIIKVDGGRSITIGGEEY